MKKRVVCVMFAAMALSLAVPAAAAPSIGQIIPEAPEVISGELTDGQELIVQNADTDAYANKTVASVVEKANDDNVETTVKELLTDLNVDTAAEFSTTTGKTVNPVLYEQLTAFVDVAIKEGDKITYESTGSITVSATFEAAKERDRKDLLIMQINPTTGAVSFSTVESLDPTTGEVTTTLSGLGPIALLEKVPVVVRDTDPDEYADETTAAVITEYKEETDDISLLDVLTSITDLTKLDSIATKDEQGISILDPVFTITLEDETTIEIDLTKYTSAMGFADLAIKQGAEDYLYDMDGKFTADANRDITNNVNWQKIVTASGADIDLEAAEEDLSLLTEIEPFTIEGSIVVQVDPTDGVVDVIYEPEMYFAYPDETNEETTAAEVETESEDEDELMAWEVEDEDKESQDYPNLVIRAEYQSMGPFALFLQSEE